MRTKTLLLSAAALLAGLVSSQAQNVYSANVVGYYNVTVPANGYWFLANQFTNNAGNLANDVLTNGLASDPGGTTNTVLYYWNGAGYNAYSFFKGSDFDSYWGASGSPSGFYDAGSGNYQSTLQIKNGSGSYLYNPFTGGSLKVTMVGQVVQGTNVATISPGYNALSLFPAVSTNIDSALAGFPGTSDPAGANNDVLFIPINTGGYRTASYFTGADWDSYWGVSGSPAGFYDPGSGDYRSTDPLYKPVVGQAFFVRHLTGTTVNWTNVFNVQ